VGGCRGCCLLPPHFFRPPPPPTPNHPKQPKTFKALSTLTDQARQGIYSPPAAINNLPHTHTQKWCTPRKEISCPCRERERARERERDRSRFHPNVALALDSVLLWLRESPASHRIHSRIKKRETELYLRLSVLRTTHAKSQTSGERRRLTWPFSFRLDLLLLHARQFRTSTNETFSFLRTERRDSLADTC
jgi:hypothetical protein